MVFVGHDIIMTRWSRIDLSNITDRRNSAVIYVYLRVETLYAIGQCILLTSVSPTESVLRQRAYSFNDRKLYCYHTTRIVKTRWPSSKIMSAARRRTHTTRIVVLLRYSIGKTKTNYYNYHYY